MEYHLTIIEDDNLRFNVFQVKESTSAVRKRFTTITIVYLVLYSAAFVWFTITRNSVAGTIILVCAILNLLLLDVPSWWENTYRFRLRCKLWKLHKNGMLPPEENAAIVLQEEQFLWRYNKGEIRVPYTDVVDICRENGLICLYTRAPQAFVLPVRCLKGDADKVIGYLRERTGKAPLRTR